MTKATYTGRLTVNRKKFDEDIQELNNIVIYQVLMVIQDEIVDVNKWYILGP